MRVALLPLLVQELLETFRDEADELGRVVDVADEEDERLGMILAELGALSPG